MRSYSWILFTVLLFGFTAFSQQKTTEHIVAKGETISKIAKQYHLKEKDLYELNPEAKKGIKFNSVLLIPVATQNDLSSSKLSSTSEITHEVLPKETLYGISKEYGVSVDDLYKMNPTLEESGLRVGQKITILGSTIKPNKNNVKTELSKGVLLVKSPIGENNSKLTEEFVYEVLPKQTKYSIAKEHGITVADLDKANPVLENEGLKIGQKIIIPTKEVAGKENRITNEIAVSNVPISNKDKVDVKPIVENKIEEVTVTHTVLPKETKYGIAKEFGITVKELERQNPKVVNRLNVGSLLTIRSPKILNPTVVKQEFVGEPIEEASNLKSYQDTDFVEQLISTASENIGVRYRSGGTTKDGFDCSGLMCTTFGAYDIQLPRTSIEQSQYGQVIEIDNAQKGDLIFFKTRGGRKINHVGMVVEVVDGDVKFIHASSSGVIISSIKESYYSKRVVQVNRVL